MVLENSEAFAKFLEMVNQIDASEDTVTMSIKNTNSDHSAIHLGYGQCTHLYLATLASTAKQVYRFKGPSTKFAHIKNIEVTAQGSTLAIRIIKNATITGAGVEVTNAIQNLNHNSSDVAESKIYNGTVTYTGGAVWCEKIIQGHTGGPTIVSGDFIQNPNLEYVTKDGEEDYIIEIENIGGDVANFVGLNMFFYEEPRGLIENNS